MKFITRNIFGILTALAVFLIAKSGFAIEGLKVSVQCTNVILSWPCLDDGSEQFIVQYRPTLNATDSWQTLETSLPAVWGTNMMFYTHYGVITNPVNCDGGEMMMESEEMMLSHSSEPMATPIGGGDSIPVNIYPPGFDFSNFNISVSGTEGFLTGGEFMANSIDPNDGGEPIGDYTNSVPLGVGFYRVVRTGAHMIGVTNGIVWSGKVTVPIEVGNASGTLTSISINNNDASVAVGNSTQFSPLNAPLMAVVDTTRMSNGVYNISAYANWNDGNGGEWDASSPAIAVTVSNEISFENWVPEFGETGNSLLFRATSAHTNVDWIVDVYDSSNIYVGSVTGHTPDGDISFAWNLVDGYGVAHTNDAFFNFEISTPYIDPPAPPTYRKNDPWLAGKGAWCEVCQHAFDTIPDSEAIYQELNQFVSQAGGNGGIKPTPNSGDGSPYVLNYGADNPQGDTDWNNFRTALYDPHTRNLVYFGHGAPNGLGAGALGGVRFISVDEIATHLHTVPDGQNGRHSFRFVFVDGCDAGNAKMAQAFGIRGTENVPDMDYYDASLRPSCYVGWPDTKWIGVKYGGGPNYDHINFIADIQHTMLFYGQTIHVAVSQSGGANGGLFLNNNMKIFGSWNVTMTSNNQ